MPEPVVSLVQTIHAPLLLRRNRSGVLSRIITVFLALATAIEVSVAADAFIGEVICAPTNSAPPVVSHNQPESSRRMAARLEEFARTSNPRLNTFMNVESAENYRRILKQTTNLQQLVQLKPLYAQELVQAGLSEAALKEFESFEGLLADNEIPLPERIYPHLMTAKAMCLLRLAEQENCILNHNADSCLLPIQGGGIHKMQRGSRGAIYLLSELLSRHSDDLRARWLLNIAYMTVGEYPDKVPAPWLISPKTFESDYDIKRFPDVAGKLGLDVDDLAGGVVMEDFDNDGFLDLMVSAWGLRGQLRLFRNNGDGTFTERSGPAGLAGLTSGLNMIHGDYNNDGYADVLVLRGAWLGAAGRMPNSLLRNNGDFTFTDVTEEAGLLSFFPTQAAVWFDFNADGLLDIFIGNESTPNNPHPCELYRNNGNGTFTECAKENGLNLIAFVKGVASGDYNNDGRPDLYLSCRGLPKSNYLWRNDGPVDSSQTSKSSWKFTEVTQLAGIAEPITSFPCWFWDYDNDGALDLLVTGYAIKDMSEPAADYLGLPHHGERARLYRNKGDGTFTNVTAEAGLYKVLHAMGCNFGDLDNDGWLDFYVGTGDPELPTLLPNRMFRNNGGKKFQEVTTSGGFGQIQKGHAIAFGDIDNDGDQDIYSVVGGAYVADNYRNQLFANPGHANHWLKLKLQGVKSNRPGIGARIKVVLNTPKGERSLFRTVGSGASFGASTLRQEIGLGDATAIKRVEVFWPVTGKTQVLSELKMDQFYLIREDATAAAPTPVNLARFNLPTAPTAPVRHHGHAFHSGHGGSLRPGAGISAAPLK